MDTLQTVVETAGANGSLVEVLVLKAIASQALDDDAAALQALGEALILGEPEGYTCIFLNEGAAMGVLLRKIGDSVLLPSMSVNCLERWRES